MITEGIINKNLHSHYPNTNSMNDNNYIASEKNINDSQVGNMPILNILDLNIVYSFIII